MKRRNRRRRQVHLKHRGRPNRVADKVLKMWARAYWRANPLRFKPEPLSGREAVCFNISINPGPF